MKALQTSIISFLLACCMNKFDYIECLDLIPEIPSPTLMPPPTYDYVIVGGGTAGLVVANVLSEDPNRSVIVLEAGGTPLATSDVPLESPLLQKGPMDWQYETEPQEKSCKMLEGQKSRWPKGKALGGTSAINYMMCVRGTKSDYDSWAEKGATGWSWEEMLPYLLEFEDNHDQDIVSNGYHGVGGKMSVERSPCETPLVSYYLEGFKELGFNIDDINLPDPNNNFMMQQNFMHDGKRNSTYSSYLKPIEGKWKNLVIVRYAHVTKILIDDNKRAIGVEYEVQLSSKTVLAAKEVILCAGAIGSPQILMLSGVGPKEHLQSLGIQVKIDLPGVGENLQDHVGTGFPFVLDKIAAMQQAPEVFESVLVGNNTDFTKNCPLKSTLVETAGFFCSKNNTDNDTRCPDIEVVISSIVTPAVLGGEYAMYSEGMTYELYAKYFMPYHLDLTIFCVPSVMHPESKGSITLRSKNPYDHPKIDPKYFEDEQDLDLLCKGLKKCWDFAKTPSMQRFKTQPFRNKFPGCENFEEFSDEYCRCIPQMYTRTDNHPVGTCKMGAETDRTAVVDPRLRVLGNVTGLRVIDSSVMPCEITGHTEAPTLAIALKGADMIIEDEE